MKSILFIFIMVMGLCTVGIAQSEKLNSGDSLRIERTTISSELIQLRDSISISILAFDAKLKKSVKLIAASKELTGYNDNLNLDIEEIEQIGINSWSADSMKRIHLDTVNTRREYKRVCTLL